MFSVVMMTSHNCNAAMSWHLICLQYDFQVSVELYFHSEHGLKARFVAPFSLSSEMASQV